MLPLGEALGDFQKFWNKFEPFNHPVPDLRFLGIHTTSSIDGKLTLAQLYLSASEENTIEVLRNQFIRYIK